MMEAIADFLTSVFDVNSETAEIISVSIVGLGILAICVGFGYGIAKILEKTGNAIDSAGKSGLAIATGIGSSIASAGTSLENVSSGVQDFISTPKVWVEEASKVRQAEIAAYAPKLSVSTSNAQGDKVSIDLSGEGMPQIAEKVLNSSGDLSRQVNGGSIRAYINGQNSRPKTITVKPGGQPQ